MEVFGVGKLLVMLDLISNDYVTGYAIIFWRENMKYCNLPLANWKNIKM